MQTDSSPNVTAIIVNYETSRFIAPCLDSLVIENNNLNGKLRVTIVDNCSSDTEYNFLFNMIAMEKYSSFTTLIKAKKNGGFAYGVNLGVQHELSKGDPDYIWLLNPDTICKEGACKNLVSYSLKNPDAAICGSRLEDADGSPQFSAFNFPSLISEALDGLQIGVFDKLLSRHLVRRPIKNTPYKTDWVSGASVLIRTDVILNTGPMDDQYFLYYEETDYFFNAMQLGYNCWYVPDSIVLHHVGGATKISDISNRRPLYWFESRRRFFLKNKGKTIAFLADFLWISCHALWLIKIKIQKKQNHQPQRFFLDFIKNSIFYKGFNLK